MKKEVLLTILVIFLIVISGCRLTSKAVMENKGVLNEPINDAAIINETNITSDAAPYEDINADIPLAEQGEDINIQNTTGINPEPNNLDNPGQTTNQGETDQQTQEQLSIEQPRQIEEDKRAAYLKKILSFPKIDLTERLKESFKLVVPERVKDAFSNIINNIKTDIKIKIPFFKLKEYEHEIFKNRFVKDDYNIINKEHMFIPDLNLKVKDYLIIDNVILPLYKENLGGVLVRKETKLKDNGGKLVYGFKNNDIRNKEIQFLWEIEIPLEYSKINNFDLSQDFEDYSVIYKLNGNKNYKLSFNDVKENFGNVYASYDKDKRILSVYSAKRTIKKDEEIILDPEWGLDNNYSLEFVSWSVLGAPGDYSGDVSGDYFYVSSNAFAIFDTTDKSNAAQISIFRPLESGNPGTTAVYGDYAYVEWSWHGIRVFDISDKTNPIIVKDNFLVSNNYQYVRFIINYPYLYAFAMVSTTEYYLLIIDISNSENPVLRSTFDLRTLPGNITDEHSPFGFFVNDNFAYFTFGPTSRTNASGPAMLHIIDISTPDSPVYQSSFDMGDVQSGDGPPVSLQMDIIGNNLYVMGPFIEIRPAIDFKIIDISDPDNPSIKGNWSSNTFSAYNIDFSGDYAFITSSSSGLYILDITDPLDPILTGSIIMPLPDYYSWGQNFRVKIDGNYAYLWRYDFYGVYIVNVTNKNAPTLSGMIEFSHALNEFDGEGSYVYGAIWDFLQFYVIDMSVPESPEIINRTEVLGGAWGLDVKGNYAYEAMGMKTIEGETGGLHIFDVTNPQIPVHVGYSPPIEGVNHDVEVYADTTEMMAYVAVGESVIWDWLMPDSENPGMRIVDVSDPYNPNQVGYVGTQYQIRDVYKAGDYAYLGGNDTLYIIDVTDSQNPTIIGEWQTPQDNKGHSPQINAVYTNGNYAYIAANELFILDVSNPSSSLLVNTYDLNGCNDVKVVGDYAYVIDSNSLRMLDISDPVNPSEIASQIGIFNMEPVTVDVDGEYIYVNGGGLYTFKLEDTTTCEYLNGYICEETQYCNGELIQASNTEMCCSVPCSETSLCSECGGLLGFGCTREECYGILEGCYFLNNFIFPNDCNTCLNAVCSSYSQDQQTCTDDPCNLGNCLWENNLCVTSECTNGQTQLCPLQQGVCLGSFETCTNNAWPGCTSLSSLSYGANYQASEISCTDSLDNDCDGLIDSNDPDCIPCNTGQTQLCPNQNGVCVGSLQNCINNQWPGCSSSSYGTNYQSAESVCTDDLDNDCDSDVDCDDANCNNNPACIQPGPGQGGGGGGGGGGSSSNNSQNSIIVNPPVIVSNQSNSGQYEQESPLNLYTIDLSNDFMEFELEEKNYLLRIDNIDYSLIVNEINQDNVRLQINSQSIEITFNNKGNYDLDNNVLYMSLLNINSNKAVVRFEIIGKEVIITQEQPRRTTASLLTNSLVLISSGVIVVILLALIIYYVLKIKVLKYKNYNKEEVKNTIEEALKKGYSKEEIKREFLKCGWPEDIIDKFLKNIK